MDTLARAQQGNEKAFEALMAPFQRELRAHCYRMAGSIDDADDLLQESMLKAWRSLPAFEGRSSLRTWLYRVTTSTCIDRLKSRSARKRAEDLGPASRAHDPIPEAAHGEWIEPAPSSLYADDAPSPEARVTTRESVSLAFLASLQLLPPAQRATLIACDVLGFSAEECAAVLDTTVPAVRSALQRARDSIATRVLGWTPAPPREEGTRALLARYVDAWNRADHKALLTLLHSDATMAMPPLPIWMHGAADIAEAIGVMVFASCAVDTFRAVATEANGVPALAFYRRGDDGSYAPFALHVLQIDGDSVRGLTAYLDIRVLRTFDLPPSL